MKWSQAYGNLTIQNKFFLLTSLILLVVCTVSLVAVQIATNIYDAKIYSESGEVLSLSSSVLDYELRKIEKLSFQILTDYRIQDYLDTIQGEGQDGEQNNYKLYKTKDLLRERAQFLSHQEKFISSVQVIDATGGIITVGVQTQTRGSPDTFADVAKKGKGAVVWSASEYEPNTLLAVREIRKVRNLSLEHLGTLVIRIDMTRLISDTLELSDDKIFLIKLNDSMIMSSHPVFSKALAALPIQGAKGYQVATVFGEKYGSSLYSVGNAYQW